uniref:Adenosine deaminase n=1 Tax=Trichuris muris TaxID=70415 RepID=A0A5S6QVS4_TRIMR
MANFPKIELHIHLDGAVRHDTIVDLAKQKQIPLPSYDVKEFRAAVITQTPASLEKMLRDFGIFVPVLIGDPEALERVAYEYCAIQAENNVIYSEIRYSPHLLSNVISNNPYIPPSGPYRAKGDVGPERVVQCINEGLRKGQRDFGIQVRSLLCCIVGYSDWSEEILRLCNKYKSDGVVGIDQAGANVKFGQHEISIFNQAEKMGIHRTVHAGETGTADNVKQAIEDLHVERIGHGYRVLQDAVVYESLKMGGQHLELCPLSSVVTGSVGEDWTQHPAKRFLKDRINFSINTDDPTILDNSMNSEFDLCKKKLQFTDQDLFYAVCNAARSAFLSDEERDALLLKVKRQWPQ